jgi:hypothetical protein
MDLPMILRVAARLAQNDMLDDISSPVAAVNRVWIWLRRMKKAAKGNAKDA